MTSTSLDRTLLPRVNRARSLPIRLLAVLPWLLAIAVGVLGVAGVTPLVWVGAGLVAGVSLSGSV